MGSARTGSNPVGVVFVYDAHGEAYSLLQLSKRCDSMAERSKAPA
jgi:hypothetical protein